MPRKEGYKKKGKSKKSDVGTRAYVVKDQKGNKLDGEKMSRYQVVGKTKSGKLQLEIVVSRGRLQGIGSPTIEVSPERWNIQFAINPPKNYNPDTSRKMEDGGKGKAVWWYKGRGGGEKKVQGKAAAKIQRAVRRRLKGVKRVRAEQVAKEEKFAPELRKQLGKTATVAPIGFNVEVVGTGQEAFEPVDKQVSRKVKQGGYWVDEKGDSVFVSSSTPGATYLPEYEKTVISKPSRTSAAFGMTMSDAEKRRIATARVGNKQLVLKEDYNEIPKESYFIRDGWGKGLHKLMAGYSNWIVNELTTLEQVSQQTRMAMTEKELRREVRGRVPLATHNRWIRSLERGDDPKFFRNLLRADRLHGFASTYNYNKASKDWRERGGSNK